MLNYPFKYLEESICVSINPTTQGEAIMDQFSTADRQRYAELKTEAKQQEFLWSRSALHASRCSFEIHHLSRQKANHQRTGTLALATAKNGVSAAFSKDLEVGIDIETKSENPSVSLQVHQGRGKETLYL